MTTPPEGIAGDQLNKSLITRIERLIDFYKRVLGMIEQPDDVIGELGRIHRMEHPLCAEEEERKQQADAKNHFDVV